MTCDQGVALTARKNILLRSLWDKNVAIMNDKAAISPVTI
jgi:hypothetical protein